MESVIIITPQSITLNDFINRLPPTFSHEQQEENDFLIYHGEYAAGPHCWLDADQSVSEDFEDSEMVEVKEWISEPKFFALSSNNLPFVKQVLSAILFSGDFLVDDDHGHIIKAKDFLDRMRTDPTWDWRI